MARRTQLCTFEYPSYANLDTINDIIESILDFHGVDAYKHPYTGEEPISPPRKKKRVAGSIDRNIPPEDVNEEEVDDAHIDNNDNSLNDAPEDGPPVLIQNQQLSAYELIREQNIAELENMKETLSLLPHSRVRKTWGEN